MATSLQDTPSSHRLHIGVFGRTNSGKSSFINAFTKQQVSITSEVAGTTTDPVYKPMEIHPLGPCVLIDTAGFDDHTELGGLRMEKTCLAAEKTDLAILLFPEGETDLLEELHWYHYFREKKTPVLLVISKSDVRKDTETLSAEIQKATKKKALCVSAVTGEGMETLKEALIRLLPENYGDRLITADLVEKEDLVLLVMPQDIQAPKGRLILPQVQTLRELLDKKCLVMSVTTNQLKSALKALVRPPKLIITDSQVFQTVYEQKPKESMLTSFSVLFAAYKGDLPYYVEGAKKRLTRSMELLRC